MTVIEIKGKKRDDNIIKSDDMRKRECETEKTCTEKEVEIDRSGEGDGCVRRKLLRSWEQCIERMNACQSMRNSDFVRVWRFKFYPVLQFKELPARQ